MCNDDQQFHTSYSLDLRYFVHYSVFVLVLVVSREQCISSEDKALLVWRNALFVLDLLLHIVDGIRWLHFEGDGLASESLDENLHFNYYKLNLNYEN